MEDDTSGQGLSGVYHGRPPTPGDEICYVSKDDFCGRLENQVNFQKVLKWNDIRFGDQIFLKI